jgi:hypothetical protein
MPGRELRPPPRTGAPARAFGAHRALLDPPRFGSTSVRGSAEPRKKVTTDAGLHQVGRASRRARYCSRYSQASMPCPASESSSARSSEACRSARSSGLSSSSITTTLQLCTVGQVGWLIELDAAVLDPRLERVHGLEDTAYSRSRAAPKGGEVGAASNRGWGRGRRGRPVGLGGALCVEDVQAIDHLEPRLTEFCTGRTLKWPA